MDGDSAGGAGEKFGEVLGDYLSIGDGTAVISYCSGTPVGGGYYWAYAVAGVGCKTPAVGYSC